MSLVPIFENPRTKTVHHFKRLPDGRPDNIGITACGREEIAKDVSWTEASAITCATCLRSGIWIQSTGRVW
jgi:hypothetical protein